MGPALLDRRLYSFGDVDAYLGLKAGTARRWIDGYRRRDHDYPPVIRERRTGDEAVSWGEFIETRLLASFRQRGATLQSLRPAVQRLREELSSPYPLATAKPYLDLLGKELVLNVQEASGVDPSVRLVVVRSGQLVLTPAVARFVDDVVFEDGVAQTLAADRATPEVRIDPRRAQGRPAIRSVPTEVLAEGFRAGESLAELATLYELSESQVLEAIRFEMRNQQERVTAA